MQTETSAPIVDREFAERFMRAVDRPMDYGVYVLFHDFWKEAPQTAIDAYLEDLLSIPGIAELINEGFIAEPLTMERLEACAPGTLGHGYRGFIIENGLEANLGRNYREYNQQLHASGALDRLPQELSYMMLRGFQTHDFHHVLTGIDSSPWGELELAAFYLAQLRFPYHAMRMAVTLGHAAFVNPSLTVDAMDQIVQGWQRGRQSGNVYLPRYEEELDMPVEELRARIGIAMPRDVALAA